MNQLDDPEVLALTSPEFVEVRIDLKMARAEFAAQAAVRQTAELWSSIADLLRDVERHPEVFIDGRVTLTAAERREYAIRSAVADLAVRLAVAENSIRAWGLAAQLLRADLPGVWAAFRDGQISVANVRSTAEFANDLDSDARAAFEQAVLEVATRLSPARFRAVARAARERVHERGIAERHERAASGRRLSVDDDLDGMSWLGIYLPSATAHRVVAGIDAAARSLQGQDDRTLAQLRADVAADALSGSVFGLSASAGVAVSVTVPVLTLLGHSDEPGILHGVGPIDVQTARLLAAEAPSFMRILTHPITGTVLELDRTVYRVPADLRRALGFRDRSCRFAGCGRKVAGCDVDHIVEWQDGGATNAANLMLLCRHHHRLKSVARWRVRAPEPGSGSVTWTSPTGNVTQSDPPPF
jgi:hypothetical protein